MGQQVLVTNYPEYYKLSNFLTKYNTPNLGLVLGIYNFQQIFQDDYASSVGGLLGALGQLFRKNVKAYIYPYKSEEGQLESLGNLEVPEASKHLYSYLTEGGYLKDIKTFNQNLIHIYSSKVLSMIVNNEPGWEEMVPDSVAKTIHEKCLFGHPCFLDKKKK